MATSKAPLTDGLRVLVQSIKTAGDGKFVSGVWENGSFLSGLGGTALSVPGVIEPRFGRLIKGGELPGEEGTKSEGDGTVNAFWLPSRLSLKASVQSRGWSRLSCGRPQTREIKAVAVTTKLILKADENILWKDKG